MDRACVASALSAVSPTLATAGAKSAEILSYLCFLKGSVWTYNGIAGIRTDCDVPITGAIPGAQLISILSESRAKDIAIVQEGDDAKFVMGRAKMKLSVIAPDEFLITPPKLDGTRIPMTEELIRAIEIAAKSGGDDSVDIRSGITLQFGKKRVAVYASDNVVVVNAVTAIKAPELDGTSIIIPSRFYKLIGSRMKELMVCKSGEILAIGDGIELFSRIIPGAKVEQFDKLFLKPSIASIPKTDIPAGLVRCLRRAVVVSDLTEFRYTDGRLNMLSQGMGAELRDSIKIDLGSKPLAIVGHSESILRYMDIAKRIGFGNECVVVEGDGFRALAAVKTI